MFYIIWSLFLVQFERENKKTRIAEIASLLNSRIRNCRDFFFLFREEYLVSYLADDVQDVFLYADTPTRRKQLFSFV